MFGDQRSKTGPLNRFHDRHQARGRHQVGLVELVVHIDPPAQHKVRLPALNRIRSNSAGRSPERDRWGWRSDQRQIALGDSGEQGIQTWGAPASKPGQALSATSAVGATTQSARPTGGVVAAPAAHDAVMPCDPSTVRPGASRAGLAVVVAVVSLSHSLQARVVGRNLALSRRRGVSRV